MRPCSIIDAPSDLGLRHTGVDGLPDALRAAGLLEGLPGSRYAGSVPAPAYSPLRDRATGIHNLEAIAGYSDRLAERVTFTLDLGRFPLVLGGDCSIVLGAALALRRRGRFGLFFIDGHADSYPAETELNGEVASMDLAVATGRELPALADLDGLRPLVREEDVAVFGVRDVEDEVADGAPDVRGTAMHVYDLAEVRKLGAAEAARQGRAALETGGVEGFWIHLDADVLNGEVMPAVDYVQPDGLWPAELTDALAVALASPLAVGMDVTIYNPSFDDAERSAARTLAQAITTAFARVARSSGE
jgi:arginase